MSCVPGSGREHSLLLVIREEDSIATGLYAGDSDCFLITFEAKEANAFDFNYLAQITEPYLDGTL